MHFSTKNIIPLFFVHKHVFCFCLYFVCRGKKQACVNYAAILMQIQSWALSHPDYNSTSLRSTGVRPPLLSRKITARYNLNHNPSTLKQFCTPSVPVEQVMMPWSSVGMWGITLALTSASCETCSSSTVLKYCTWYFYLTPPHLFDSLGYLTQ